MVGRYLAYASLLAAYSRSKLIGIGREAGNMNDKNILSTATGTP